MSLVSFTPQDLELGPQSLPSLVDLKSKDKGAQRAHRIQEDFIRLKTHDDYHEFVWYAFNMDTVIPLNQTHCIMLRVETKEKKLIKLFEFRLVENKLVNRTYWTTTTKICFNYTAVKTSFLVSFILIVLADF